MSEYPADVREAEEIAERCREERRAQEALAAKQDIHATRESREAGQIHGRVVLNFGVRDLDHQQHAAFVIDVLRQPCHTWTNIIADQIEAQTAPPKPDEPLGLGAVVEDAEGERWVQFFSSNTGHWWRNHRGQHRRWSDISAVRVLSSGVDQ